MVTLGIAVASFFAGRLNVIEGRVERHVSAAQHLGSEIKIQDIDRRLTRIENNQEKILDELRKP